MAGFILAPAGNAAFHLMGRPNKRGRAPDGASLKHRDCVRPQPPCCQCCHRPCVPASQTLELQRQVGPGPTPVPALTPAIAATSATGGTSRPQTPQPSSSAPPSRRVVLRSAAAVALLLVGAVPLTGGAATAEPEGAGGTAAAGSGAVAAGGPESAITQKVYLDVTVDRQPVGRIVIGLYGRDVPVGAARFAELAKSAQGVGYRRKPFEIITSSYIRNAGVRSFSPGDVSSTQATIPGGPAADVLIEEMAALNGRLRHVPGTVSILAVDSDPPPVETKLQAVGGKLVMVEEKARAPPNGSVFDITFADAPELDATNLIVGRVITGFDVLQALAALPVNRDNSSNPYFQLGKSLGDKRALVAERGFNRPFAKVVVSGSGVLDD